MGSNVKELTESVFDNFKKITPALIAVAIASGLVLFLPDAVLTKMALGNIPENIKRIIGIVFILSVAVSIVLLAYNLLKPIINKHNDKRLRFILRERYIALSNENKAIVKQIIQAPNMTMQLDANYGNIRYLESNQIIVRLSTMTITDSPMRMRFPYTVQGWVMDLYKNEPELFK